MTTRRDLNEHLDRGVLGGQRKEIAVLQSKHRDNEESEPVIIKRERVTSSRGNNDVPREHVGMLKYFLKGRKHEARVWKRERAESGSNGPPPKRSPPACSKDVTEKRTLRPGEPPAEEK